MKKYKITHTNKLGETAYGFIFAPNSVAAKHEFFANYPEIDTAFIQFSVDGNWGDSVKINRSTATAN